MSGFAFLSDPALLQLFAALPGARVVGGAVRDALAGRPIADFDLATPDPPSTVIARLAGAGLKAVPTGLAHGTVTALAAARAVEITTLRRDISTDGRHAIVDFTDDWRQDAARRDFTINAMSVGQDGVLHDYFDGAADLRAGRVRFVGVAAARVAEDYLRILRFFRFFARYGSGAPDEDAVRAIAAGRDRIAMLSVERVWREVRRLLTAPEPLDALRLMERIGVLATILPEGADIGPLAALLGRGAPAAPLLRLAALLAGDAEALAQRWKLSTAECDHLLALRAAPPLPANTDDAAIRRALADTPAAVLIGRAWLGHGDTTLIARIAATEAPVFPLHGRDLAALGMGAGPAMGARLRALRAWWLAGGCVADAAAILRYARSG